MMLLLLLVVVALAAVLVRDDDDLKVTHSLSRTPITYFYFCSETSLTEAGARVRFKFKI